MKRERRERKRGENRGRENRGENKSVFRLTVECDHVLPARNKLIGKQKINKIDNDVSKIRK